MGPGFGDTFPDTNSSVICNVVVFLGASDDMNVFLQLRPIWRRVILSWQKHHRNPFPFASMSHSLVFTSKYSSPFLLVLLIISLCTAMRCIKANSFSSIVRAKKKCLAAIVDTWLNPSIHRNRLVVTAAPWATDAYLPPPLVQRLILGF